MIGQLTVNISAKDPTRKCETFRAFVGSPSNVRIVGVPSSLGNWNIQTVYFTVNYPDNRSVSKTCKKGVGVYVATIEGSTIPGKSLLGYTVTADGVDENGQPVTGYVLGKGDVEIVDADATLTPGETTYYIHLLQSRPETPHKGDAYVDGGVWWFYNGSAWITLGGTFAGNGWAQYPQSLGGDGKWHRVIISNGTLAYDEQGFDEPPDAAPFALKSELTAEKERATAAENAKVPTNGDHTVNGVKTFTQSPLVPTIQSTGDNSQKAASTGWVKAKIEAWWNAIKSTVTFAKSQVGLGNVDNTRDQDKPISTATQAALDAKANENAVVKLTGNQTIDGDKTFSGKITITGSSVKGSAFAAAGMPSGTFVTPWTSEQMVNGASYTATKNGWLIAKATNSSDYSYILFQDNQNAVSCKYTARSDGESMIIMVPVLAGKTVYLYIQGDIVNPTSRFVYSNAEA